MCQGGCKGKCGCNVTAITKGEKGDAGAQGAKGDIGEGFLSTKVSLTASQIRSLNSVPVDAIAAPGAGKAIQIISVSGKFNYNSIPFDQGDTLKISALGSSAEQCQITSFLSRSVNSFRIVTFRDIIDGLQIISNVKLTITADLDSTAGNSTVDVYILYRIITL